MKNLFSTKPSLPLSSIAFALILASAVSAVSAGRLPPPTGPYTVGMTRHAFVDTARPEIFTEPPDDRREVTVTAWYPAEYVEGANRAPYYPMAGEMLGRFFYPDSLADIETSSWLGLPVAGGKERFPVVVFNHGWGEHVGQSTVLMQELASHGFIVFSIGHHHESKFWVYPDGRVTYLDTQNPVFQQRMAEQSQPGVMDLFNSMFTARGIEEQRLMFRKSIETMPVMLKETPRMWAQDISFVIDRLDSLNRSGDGDGWPFKGRLDLERLGVAGMSMGGIAAGQVCIGDRRVRACINTDGGLFADLLDNTLTVPVMFMGSRRFIGYEDTFAGSSDGDVYTVIVADSDHYDFTDLTLLHRQHVLLGTVDGRRMLELVNAYTLAFLEQYLRGSKQDILETIPSPFPEVEFQAFPGKSR
jgi:predicted dienelactone hydrolase